MPVRKRKSALMVLALLLSGGTAPASASSSSTIWNVYVSSEGARLNYIHSASFLGSEEVSRKQLFSAICNPNQPTPYITTVIQPRGGETLYPSQNLKVRLEDGNYMFLLGNIDQIATVNAGDQLTRYGVSIPVDSVFFRTLMQPGSRYELRIDADPGNGGVPLRVTDRDRERIGAFLQTCTNYGAGSSQTVMNAEPPYACRDFLNGPNQYAGNQSVTYEPGIIDRVCGDMRMDVRPANCMHYVMSGNVAWDRQGNAAWQPANAADLCSQSTDIGARIQCFNIQIAHGADWYSSIQACRSVN
ncbi:hypothetical protein [Hoeflea alexandrii]|uniref:hypothetical protein n=1 Tax=Hoeflea alexandrii TaxID=288436 RepID=UPI0022AF2E1D|nr:hypothetical protein [Hoeflea alexandrii]MCZ4291279.1 hypothetical protein [Hoeflea alexandrii]